MSENYTKIAGEAYFARLCDEVRSRSRRAYIRTFGCQQNEADSEKIMGILREIGYSLTDTPDEADLIILNTCSVRRHAEEKVFSLLGSYKEYKARREGLIIGVVGCMGANASAVKLLKESFHYVDFTLGASAMHKIPRILYSLLTVGGRMFIPPDEREPIVEGIPTLRSGRSAYVSIMYGCNNFCSYCIVPYTRGRERSRCSEDILAECRALADEGVGEITLLGQNVNSYSADIDFPELLSRVAQIPGDFTIRFMTSHPKDVTERLVRVMASYPEKIAPAFHLPLQSGSDRILRDMNRKYDRARFLSVARMIKENIPEVYLTTDVIVGYPGESDDDFLATLEVLSEVKFDAVYAFVYSKRDGTLAAERKDTVGEDIKKERITRLLKLQDELLLEKNASLIGRTLTVFCEKSAAGGERSRGKTASGRGVLFDIKRAVSNEFIKVKITSVTAYSLYGVAEE